MKELFKGTYTYLLFGSVNFIIVYLSSFIVRTNGISLLFICGLCFLVYGALMLIFNNPIKADLLNLIKSKRKDRKKIFY